MIRRIRRIAGVMMSMRRSTAGRAALLLLVALGVSSSVTSAQDRPASPQKSGEIHGTVATCGGASVEGTLVYIPGRNFEARLAANGVFVLNYVPVGTYTLVITVPNRPNWAVEGVVASDNKITTVPPVNLCRDADGDGYTEDVDCNDNNPKVYPGAPEICDGLDNNCNGTVDEGCPVCTDADKDGYYAQAGCGTAVDCNDNDPTVHPAATEVCNGKDDNCNGTVDEGFNLQTDTSNCGKCGNVCSMANATASCVEGACHLASCAAGYTDCNGLASDGCEASLASDVANCGACGNACSVGQTCSASKCVAVTGCTSDAQCGPSACEGTVWVRQVCTAGTCQPLSVSCEDGNGCTIDVCNAGGGCSNTSSPSGTACSVGGAGGICDGTGTCILQ
jgi:putative metal-binding protein